MFAAFDKTYFMAAIMLSKLTKQWAEFPWKNYQVILHPFEWCFSVNLTTSWTLLGWTWVICYSGH